MKSIFVSQLILLHKSPKYPMANAGRFIGPTLPLYALEFSFKILAMLLLHLILGVKDLAHPNFDTTVL